MGAYGILAQSIGGGGGVSAASRFSGSTGGIGGSMTLSGANGVNGNGNWVTVNGTADISTAGANAIGLLAQSIGGGGGVASFTTQQATSGGAVNGQLGDINGSGIGLGVNVTDSASIATTGNRAIGLLAQSISGGGGLAALATGNASTFGGQMTLGATGGGAAGNVDVNVNLTSGSITTAGDFAYGVAAQSVTGGGGLSQVASGAAALGGAMGGQASAVNITNGSAISTTGYGAIGIVAQSIAGGGGFALAAGSAQLGGTAGANSGSVTVNSNAKITTTGDNAIGILAQSIGGGGGTVLSTGGALSANARGVAANSGAVTVNVNAAITTSGRNAYGVVAQSVAGGGGLIIDSTGLHQVNANSGGQAGLVTINVRSGVSIIARGAGASAIYGHSSTDPVVNIEAGANVTGGDGGYAVLLDSPVNQINNAGTLGVSGDDGTAIKSLSGATTIANSGVLLGSITLADGAANSLHNLAGGTIQAGSLLDLGSTGAFQNDGILASASGIGEVRVNGAFSQSATGFLSIRVDQLTGKADSFSFGGATTLAGKLSLATVNLGDVRPGTFKLADIVSADGGLNTEGLTLSTVKSAILNYALSNENGKLSLISTANFTPQGISSGGAEIGKALGLVQAQGGSRLSRLMTTYLVGLDSTSRLEDAYNTVGAGGIAIAPAMILSTAQRSVYSITSRLDDWRLAPDQTGLADIWATPVTSHTTGSGLSAHLAGITLGIDRSLTSRPILFGAAFSYMDAVSRLNAPDVYAEGSQYVFSLYGGRQLGRAYIMANGLVGAGITHFSRSLGALQIAMAGAVPLHSTTFGGRFEAGYSFDLGETGGHITPYAAFEPIGVRLKTATESFVAAPDSQLAAAMQDSGITFHGRTLTAEPISLGLQIDNRWRTGGDVTFAPQLRIALVHDFNPDRDVARSFKELPDLLIWRTTVPTDADAVSVQVSGLWMSGRRWSLKAAADATLSGSYTTVGGSLSGTWNLAQRWAVTASVNAQVPGLQDTTGAEVRLRHHW